VLIVFQQLDDDEHQYSERYQRGDADV